MRNALMHPDLARLMAAWPELGPATKTAILAMIDAVGFGSETDGTPR